MKWRVFLFAGMLPGCVVKKSDTAGQDATSSTASDSGETSGGTAADWPECEPESVFPVLVTVGPDAPSGGYRAGTNWPDGSHAATCVIASTSETMHPAEGYSDIEVHLVGCVEDSGDPIALSLDLLFTSDVLGVPPTLTVEQTVRVAYGVDRSEYGLASMWYSLRDADTGALLLAVFGDPGPTVVPKVGGEQLDGWLDPLTGTLTEFVCPPDPAGCEDPSTPQRAAVDFTVGGETRRVVSGTEGDLGDYRVQLGFAGAPDACEGFPSNKAIEGVIARK
jgi:hypothetical protein